MVMWTVQCMTEPSALCPRSPCNLCELDIGERLEDQELVDAIQKLGPAVS